MADTQHVLHLRGGGWQYRQQRYVTVERQRIAFERPQGFPLRYDALRRQHLPQALYELGMVYEDLLCQATESGYCGAKTEAGRPLQPVPGVLKKYTALSHN
jgi:hypothetical protein